MRLRTAGGSQAVGYDSPVAPIQPSKTVSAIVPVYNSAATLAVLVDRLGASLRPLVSDFEIVLVNDASRDDSWSVIEQLSRCNPRVRGIDLARNQGQHNALLCGFRAARFEIIVTLDDDLQHRPEEIARLLEKLEDGYDVVYGARKAEGHGLLRNVASRITKIALQTAMGAETAETLSPFRAVRASVCRAFASYQGPYVNIDVLLTWGTTRFGAVQVTHAQRETGASNYTVRLLLRHALNMITGFSTLPLKLASLMGFVFTAFGMLVLAFVLIRYVISGGGTPGFPFLASIIAIFSGAQLFALGMIGEYLARMHFRLMDQPAYVVRGTTLPLHEEDAI
jgi:glycosyltransferase involved in cell wall biosynthesis